jgi:hypothetical protein
MHRLLLSCVLWLALSGGHGGLAQDAPDLIVTLHTIDGAPLSGATVIVRDAGGVQELARATTDAQGQATVQILPVTDIRVVVQGQLPGGARFFQPGNDAKGIALFLQHGTTHLNLLADVDGMIAPDPRTMAALEPGIPVATAEAVAFPTAPLSPRPTVTAIAAVTLPTLQVRSGATLPAGVAAAPPTAEQAPANTRILTWLGVGMLVCLIGVGIGLVALMRRWR